MARYVTKALHISNRDPVSFKLNTFVPRPHPLCSTLLYYYNRGVPAAPDHIKASRQAMLAGSRAYQSHCIGRQLQQWSAPSSSGFLVEESQECFAVV